MNIKQKLKEIFGVNTESNSTPYPKDLVKVLKDSFEKAFEIYEPENIHSSEYFDNITKASSLMGLNSVGYHNLFIALNNSLMKGYLSTHEFMQIREHLPFFHTSLENRYNGDYAKSVGIRHMISYGQIKSIDAIKALNDYCVKFLKAK